jgi:predicted component of type VI protein secretion system
VLGSNPDGDEAETLQNAAVLKLSGDSVAGKHCEFWYEEGKWILRALALPLYLNGTELSVVSEGSVPHPISDRDYIRLGSLNIHVFCD